MRKPQVFLLLLISVFSFQSKAELPSDDNPGYNAYVPKAMCEELYPHHKWIEVVTSPYLYSFDLFAYTAEEFDPNKPSILYINGGPGGIDGPDLSKYQQKLLKGFNIVYFHYRSAGCSNFQPHSAFTVDPVSMTPKPIEVDLDIYLSNEKFIQDLEVIREAFGIEVWHAIYGHSYGTTLARTYAHSFPKRMKMLLLEGLHNPQQTNINDDSSHKNLQDSRLRILEIVRSALRDEFFQQLPWESVRKFLTEFENMLYEFPAGRINGFAFYGDNFRANYPELFNKYPENLPKHLNSDTFLLVNALAYLGSEESMSIKIAISLAREFHLPVEDDELNEKLDSGIARLRGMLYPHQSDDYLELLKDYGLLSRRLAHVIFSKELDLSQLCQSKSTLVLNGSDDSATPMQNVEQYLSDKKCASANNVGIIAQGVGHSVVPDSPCVEDIVLDFLGGSKVSIPSNCDIELELKNY